MRWLVNCVVGLCLLGGGLGACAPHPVAPVTQAEAKVKTAAEARALTVQQLQATEPRGLQLRLDAIEVAEQPDEWLVYVPFQSRMKPSGVYRVIDKQTGKVRVAVGL